MTSTILGTTRLRLEISERRLLLRIGDLVLATVGSLSALAAWSIVADRPLNLALIESQLPWMLAIGLGWLAWLALADMYELRQVVVVRWSMRRIAIGAFTIGLIYIIYFFVTAVPPSSMAASAAMAQTTPLRLAPGIAILACAGLLALWRWTYALVLGGPHARRRVLVLGAGAAGTTIADVLRDSAHFQIIGFVDDDVQKLGTRICDVPVLGGHARMLELAELHTVDELIVAISGTMSGDVFQAVMDCHERGVMVTPMPLLYEQLTGKVAVEHIGSQWYVALPFESRPFSTLGHMAKRAIDILCGLVIGVVFLIALPFIALAIKLDSRGPVFYRQERMGLHGKVFTVVKFRSMVADAERDGKAQWATKNDARITRVGRIMRKTRLDELPQVINVIKGDMSMVGPRPERPQFIEKLQRQIPFYRTRLAAKPGLTGWAQVSYGYGATVEDALIKLQYDLYYIKHQSPWFDLKILLRTVGVVLKMKGQ